MDTGLAYLVARAVVGLREPSGLLEREPESEDGGRRARSCVRKVEPDERLLGTCLDRGGPPSVVERHAEDLSVGGHLKARNDLAKASRRESRARPVRALLKDPARTLALRRDVA